MGGMDEPALIRDAQKGSLEAFNSLVLAYQSPLYNLAYRMLGDPDSAADAAQEALISAHKHILQYRGGSFKAWLMRIVTNGCYDELRRRQRRPVASLEALDVTPEGPEAQGEASLVSREESPEDAVQRRELARAIQRCLGRLPDDMRLIVILCDVQDMDYAEAAAIAKVALGTVKSRLSRARAHLRDCLRDAREAAVP
jgi:RNA polymerase sigma-70 factor, ECF subfamily